MDSLITTLLHSAEPSIRYKVRVNVLQDDPHSAEIVALYEEVRHSPRVTALLSGCIANGKMLVDPYTKWIGAHWVLARLADIGYPPGAEQLLPLREQELNWLLSAEHAKNIRLINGKIRRCASQEGNALFALLRLGLSDVRCDELAAQLLQWQWPDGGWNCDRKPDTQHASFMESLIPLRALALYAQTTGAEQARHSAERAADIFLKRHLFKRQSDGSTINPNFVKLHYPCYWHYDILFALKVMAEAGFIDDPRCAAALDLLESKQLPDGGFPAEAKYYTVPKKTRSGRTAVDWGGTSKRRLNEWVSADALYVLRAAGRLNNV